MRGRFYELLFWMLRDFAVVLPQILMELSRAPRGRPGFGAFIVDSVLENVQCALSDASFINILNRG